MLTATALVLLMTPGLSFFYGGMVEKPKNGSCGPENGASTRNHFGF
jgi:ammonia channel protein AmtB